MLLEITIICQRHLTHLMEAPVRHLIKRRQRTPRKAEGASEAPSQTSRNPGQVMPSLHHEAFSLGGFPIHSLTASQADIPCLVAFMPGSLPKNMVRTESYLLCPSSSALAKAASASSYLRSLLKTLPLVIQVSILSGFSANALSQHKIAFSYMPNEHSISALAAHASQSSRFFSNFFPITPIGLRLRPPLVELGLQTLSQPWFST
jgi:hypothetical protein